MRLLLDTPVVLWWLADDAALPTRIKDLLDTETEVWVSAAAVWEVAVLQRAGRLIGPPNLPERIRESAFAELAVTASHAIIEARLPHIHDDVFDRIMIAQATCEELTLVTCNPVIDDYRIRVLRA